MSWVRATSGAAAKGVGTSLAIPALTTLAGDLLVVMFADLAGGAPPTITDNAGLTWTQLAAPHTNGVRCSAWYTVVSPALAGSTTVTLHFPSTSKGRAAILGAWAGMQSLGPLDANPLFIGDDATPYVSPSSGTLAMADELVLGFFAWQGAGGTEDTVTIDSPFLEVDSQGTTSALFQSTNVRAVMTELAVSSTDAVTCTASLPVNRPGVTGLASFRTVPPGSAAILLRHVTLSAAAVASSPGTAAITLRRVQLHGEGHGVVLIDGLVLMPPDRPRPRRPRWLVDFPNAGRAAVTTAPVTVSGDDS